MGQDRQTRIGAAFDRLFRTYPRHEAGKSEAAVAQELLARAEVYFEAVEPYHALDVEVAVRNFLNGSAPGHNPAFAPSAPMVGAECRRVMNLRLDAEAIDRRMRPRLAPPDVEKTDESRKRVLARTAELVEALAAQKRTEDAQVELERKARQARVNVRFAPDMSREAVAQRLYPGSSQWEVGDPDGDEAVA